MSDVASGIKGLIESLGSYARRIIVGVWFPGLLLFGEFAFIYHAATRPEASSFLADLLAAYALIGPSLLGAAVLVAILAGAITLGYVARDLAFWASDFWLWTGMRPTRGLDRILDQIRAVHGSEVDKVLSRYAIFERATDPAIARRLPRRSESYVREFCKLWLSVKAPNLSTEGIEIEINMDLGLVLPLLLAGFIFVFLVGGAPAVILGLILFGFALLRLYRITWARNIETELAIFNFVFAHWQKVEEPRTPVPAD